MLDPWASRVGDGMQKGNGFDWWLTSVHLDLDCQIFSIHVQYSPNDVWSKMWAPFAVLHVSPGSPSPFASDEFGRWSLSLKTSPDPPCVDVGSEETLWIETLPYLLMPPDFPAQVVLPHGNFFCMFDWLEVSNFKHLLFSIIYGM